MVSGWSRLLEIAREMVVVAVVAVASRYRGNYYAENEKPQRFSVNFGMQRLTMSVCRVSCLLGIVAGFILSGVYTGCSVGGGRKSMEAYKIRCNGIMLYIAKKKTRALPS